MMGTPDADPIYLERLSRLDVKRADSNFIRVVSYNSLADCNIKPGFFPECPRECLDITHRLKLLHAEIEAYEAEILCLQEIDEFYFKESFEPFLAITCDYLGSFSCKNGNAKEGLATFFNKEKFSLINSETISILGYMKDLPLWKSLSDSIKKRLEARNHVLQMTILESNTNATVLLVANTHLYFHSDDNHIRLIQTITCLERIQLTVTLLKDQYPNGNIAVIFCGDFNSAPVFSSIRLITTGNIENDDPDWTGHKTEQVDPGLAFKHDLNLSNSHKDHEPTEFSMRSENCIDYIFYQADKMQLLKTCSPPNKGTLANLLNTDPATVSLPNYQAPSDHLPLIADFLLVE